MISSSATIDPEIYEWIVEFLSRQRFDNTTLSKLISVFPISTSSLFLKKTLILRKIELEISDNSISEKILDYFEQLVHLDRIDRVSDSMKCAYCAVSVEITIGFLEVGLHEYSSAVMRIWTDRISLLGTSGVKALISKNLMNWKSIIESSLWDKNSRELILKNGSDTGSAHLVKVFLDDAWSNLGPPFLELVVDRLSHGQYMNLHLNPVDMTDRSSVRDTSISTVCDQIQQKAVQDIESRRHTSVENGCPFETVSSNLGRSMHHDTSTHSQNHLSLSTPIVHGMLDTLRSNFSYLKKAVVDPLPEAIHFSETLVHEMEIKRAKMNATAEVIEANRDNPSTPDSISQSTMDKDKDPETEAAYPFSESRNNRHKHMELDNSMLINVSDESSNESGGRFHVSSFRKSKRFNLPTPRRIKTSPLKAKELVKCGRRKIKRWSSFEGDTLRVAVLKHGIGNWKRILDENKETFGERNVVDLKDKWRNMCK